MRRLFPLLVLSAAIAHAQAPDASQDITTLRTTARLVTVDVAVTDSKGAGVPGLTCADFRLTDKKAPQTLRHCEDHTTIVAGTATAPPPTLPPNVFTNANAPALPPTLDIFVFDFLNAGTENQNLVKMKQELRDLVARPIPGHRVAIFAMGDKLQLISGFSDDISRSSAAIQAKLNAASPVYTGPAANITASGINTGAEPAIATDAWSSVPSMDQQVTILDQFHKLRVTLEELRAIVSFVSPLPGRKRLLWIAGSSPFNFGGDISMSNKDSEGGAWDLFKHLSNELIENRVQVFPIDVGGVVNNMYRDPAVNDDGVGGKNGNEISNGQLFAKQDFESNYHAQSDLIAAESGGKAFYGSNSLGDLYRKALNYGNQFYTLTYTPNNFNPDGSFHDFKISLVERKARISYPKGYLVPDEKADAAVAKDIAAQEKVLTGSVLPARTPAEKESAMAMIRGLPNPTSLLFTVRIVPPSKTATPSPRGPGARTREDAYGIDLSINTSDIGWIPKNDLQTATLKLRMVIYDKTNRSIETSEVPANFHLNAQQFAKARAQGLQMHFDIPLKLIPGSHLRLGMEDIASHHIGTVEVDSGSLQAMATGGPGVPAGRDKQPPAQP